MSVDALAKRIGSWVQTGTDMWARRVVISDTQVTEGTLSAMAADAAAIIAAGTETANEGKRYSVNGIVYNFTEESGKWDYYRQPGQDSGGISK